MLRAHASCQRSEHANRPRPLSPFLDSSLSAGPLRRSSHAAMPAILLSRTKRLEHDAGCRAWAEMHQRQKAERDVARRSGSCCCRLRALAVRRHARTPHATRAAGGISPAARIQNGDPPLASGVHGAWVLGARACAHPDEIAVPMSRPRALRCRCRGPRQLQELGPLMARGKPLTLRTTRGNALCPAGLLHLLRCALRSA